MRVLDKYRFESFGDVGCSNSDYRLHRATCCCSYFVEDVELLDLYLDPNNLSNRVDGVYGIPCPLCGLSKWESVVVENLADVPLEWRWACVAE